MEYKSGVLGIIVIALALTGALIGSYLAGIESVDSDKIKYNYLADVSGLFEYDQSPQYISYDPSSNYVGYYSDNSYQASTNKYYWPEFEVGYTPNLNGDGTPRVNNYRVDLEPLIDPETTIDLSTLSLDSLGGNWRVFYTYWNGSNVETTTYWTASVYTLKEIINEMSINSQVSVLRITTGNIDWNLADTEGGVRPELDAVLILPRTEFDSTNVIRTGNPNVPSELFSSEVFQPYQSFEVNLKNGNVTVYSDNNYEHQVIGNFTTDSLIVCFGNTTTGYLDAMNITEEMTYMTSTNRISYLNPNEGVHLTGGA